VIMRCTPSRDKKLVSSFVVNSTATSVLPWAPRHYVELLRRDRAPRVALESANFLSCCDVHLYPCISLAVGSQILTGR
jgi:hypothetical protein